MMHFGILAFWRSGFPWMQTCKNLESPCLYQKSNIYKKGHFWWKKSIFMHFLAAQKSRSPTVIGQLALFYSDTLAH